MDLTQNDWLQRLVEHAPPAVAPQIPPGGAVGRVRAARKLLADRLADLGLLYGTPLLSADLAPDQAPRERLFLAVHAGLVNLARALAEAMGRPGSRRDADVAVVFLAYSGAPKAAAKLARDDKPSSRAVAKAFATAAERLSERLELLTGDLVYGVPLHNGLNYAAAWSFGRIAVAYFAEGKLDVSAVERRLADQGRDRAALVEALVELVWAAGPPTPSVRRAVARQVSALDLPRASSKAVKAALEEPGGPSALAAKVRGREHRRFVLAQAVLASLVDGRRTAAEKRFLTELAKAFGFPDDELRALELGLAGFYAEHREFVDTFTAGEAGVELADELVDDLSRKVEKNLSAVVQELKQTGELAELLAKAARGNTLSVDERARMRQDLLDVAKAVPSLAILAAPGGLLLLAALTKVLPFSILPSAWDQRSKKISS
ncbi:MAG: DUF533 domain-containing protein [Deltaproteobacteria bacterium]|nr:DUF533 domain-containing protein [Deltaproteobacteria bacterium]